MAVRAVSFASHLTNNVQQKYSSVYLNEILIDIEEVITVDGTEFPKIHDLILPAVCQPFDVDISQSLIYGKQDDFTIKIQSSAQKATALSFNNLVWSCSSSCGQLNAAKSSLIMNRITEQLICFADNHFQSAATVTSMNQLDLGCLALWLSWYPSLFRENEHNEAVDDNDNGDLKLWRWHLHKENVVSGLLNVLSSPKHDPKCLSIAVACLSFLIEQHAASESVLTDANISQLLRLGLSKAVYPTVDNEPQNGITSSNLPPYWETIFCRIGVRRLLLIPQVLRSESAVNEAFTFVSKWWERLKGASKGPGSGFETPGKLVRSPNGTVTPKVASIIPVTRCALDVIADLYELIPQIKSYVRHMVVTDSFLFLTSYLSSVDPKTVISAVKLISNIISDFSSDSKSGIEGSECEKRLRVEDLKVIYECSMTQLCTYCQISGGTYTEQSQGPHTLGTLVKENTRGLSRKVLQDRTNIPNSDDVTKSASAGMLRKDRYLSAGYVSAEGSTAADQARRVACAPLIAAMSSVINTCLHAADALCMGEKQQLHSMGTALASKESLLVSTSMSILLSALTSSFRDLLSLGLEDLESNLECGPNVVGRDGGSGVPPEGPGGIFQGLVWRRRKAAFETLTSLSLLHSHFSSVSAAMSFGGDNDDSENSQQIQFSIQCFNNEIESFFQPFLLNERSGPMVRATFFSILVWGKINIEELGPNTGISTPGDMRRTGPVGPGVGVKTTGNRLKLVNMLKMFYVEIEKACVVPHMSDDKEESRVDISLNDTKSFSCTHSTHISESGMEVDGEGVGVELSIQQREEGEGVGVELSIQQREEGEGVGTTHNERQSLLGGSESADDSPNSRILTLACLGGSRTSSQSNSNDITRDNLQQNFSVDNMTPQKSVACKYESTCATPGGRVSLSKAFTPAHSKSRRQKHTEHDSRDTCTSRDGVEVESRDKEREESEEMLEEQSDMMCEVSRGQCRVEQQRQQEEEEEGDEEEEEGDEEEEKAEEEEEEGEGEVTGCEVSGPHRICDEEREEIAAGQSMSWAREREREAVGMSVDEDTDTPPTHTHSSPHTSPLSTHKLPLTTSAAALVREMMKHHTQILVPPLTNPTHDEGIDTPHRPDTRMEHVLLSSSLLAAKSEIQNLRDENLRLKTARLSLSTDRATLQTLTDSLLVEIAGLRSRGESLEIENKALIISIEGLDSDLERVKVRLIESDSRKSEQEQLLQEAWQRLAALAKKEVSTLLLNAELTAQALRATQRAVDSSSKLSSLKGREQEAATHTKALESLLKKNQILLEKNEITTQDMVDKINEKNRECEALAAELKCVKSGFKAVCSQSHTINMQLKLTQGELINCKEELEERKGVLEAMVMDSEGLRDKLEETKSCLAASEERVLAAEETVDEWKEKLCSAERGYDKEREEQCDREAALEGQLGVSIKRGDSAELELQKLQELVSFINKLSTEGEAGRAKARRLSEAVVGGDRRTDTWSSSAESEKDKEKEGDSEGGVGRERCRKMRKPCSKG